ncbi:hypothetical protein L7D48_26235 [Streptomyces sp. S1A]|uniref:hypothetical protein n=1 Tax=Streptomyces sp. ICN903 TaxID=2964654 RepID=UPI001EDB9039|nr:hypothetical protein [Streptomyces sp. ICN903]MCG3044034.1 hypothetical protein [Streptomyces sp. ICN903]
MGARTDGADGAMEAGPSSRFTRTLWWFTFHTACATAAVALAYLAPAAPLSWWLRGPATLTACVLIPLAALLIPVLELRPVPWDRRKLAWQLAFPVLTGAVLGVTAGQAGHDDGLRERGRWTQAVIVEKREGKTDRCVLRDPAGREISPDLTQGDGCDGHVEKGDVLRVLHDPEGAADPATDEDTPSYGGFLVGTALAHVALGTWGSARMPRLNPGSRANPGNPARPGSGGRPARTGHRP